MPRRVAAPRRLRRRLTVAFVVVAAGSAALLAAGSFLFVRQTRLADSARRSVDQARLNLAFAAQNLPAQPAARSLQLLVDSLVGGGFDTVAVRREGVVASSDLTLGTATIPADLRALVGRGQLAYARISVAGTPYLLAGGRVPGRDVALYFYFSEEALHRDLSQLGLALLGGFGAVVLVAGLVGRLLARSALGPVAEASVAARALAEGLLDTRLPVAGDDEFGAWASSFNEMADALEAKISALSEAQARERRFTSDVAHELRTPLTALVSEASLLREHLGAMPPDARRPAELLVGDVARLRRLVEDLMEISRLDAGREDVRTETVDVGSLVASAVRARGWEGRVRLRGDELVLRSDRRRLERIVSNLVGNAIDHGGGDVGVRFGRDATGAFVEVTDRGTGIAPEHLAHLFDRFYKADASRSGGGSGLGLAIAAENARLLGGEILVWSEVGTGTRFTLRLPDVPPM